MARKTAKSFRFNETDLRKLEEVHEYYKSDYDARVETANMDNLHEWSYAQTVAVCIRDRHEQLVKEGKIKAEN